MTNLPDRANLAQAKDLIRLETAILKRSRDFVKHCQRPRA
jgi:hypothetical protein